MINESPRLIPDNDYDPSINDLDVTDKDENKELYQRLIKSSKVKSLEWLDANFELIQYGDKYVLLNHVFKSVDYYVKVEQGSYKLLGKWNCQVEVWRSRQSPKTLVVPYVLNNHIIPKHHTVISDSIQTDAGKALWIRLCFVMLEKGKNVYIYDKNQNLLIDIPDEHVFQDKVTDAYGSSKKFENIRLVISDKELK